MNKIKKIFCVFFGHSRIIENCFGYVHCARCGELLGDVIGGVYDGSDKVIMGHNCDTCKANYKKLTLKDKFLVKNPIY